MTRPRDLEAVSFPEGRPDQAPAAALRIGGSMLSVIRRVSGWPGAGAVVRASVKSMLGLGALGDLPDAFRGELPDDPRPVRARPPRRWDDAGLALATSEGRAKTSADFIEAYASCRTTPIEVVERAIAALLELGRRVPSMNVVAAWDVEAARAAAKRSALRIERGSARPLEGVPFLVKDQHDVEGLPTAFGGLHVPNRAARNATLITRLTEAGAIVIAKTVMTEWGTSPIGFNHRATMPRNPHNVARAGGGSSTGSAVGVAFGIGPFATGADAGGSVRIPAAFNGVFGLKPTFGRVSRAGDAFGGTLNHLGVLAASSADISAFLDVVASKPDEQDALTKWAPSLDGGFGARAGDGVRGLRIGIEEREWADCDATIAARCREALRALERDGAVLVPIRIPLASRAFAIGVTTIGAEAMAITARADPERVAELGVDIQVALEVARSTSAGEFLDVQRLRGGLRAQTAAALRSVDAIAMPTTAVTAPALFDREARGAFADTKLLRDICRYSFLANLTGLPSLSAPVGIGRYGVPVGLQLVGDAWDEAALIAIAAHLERIGASRVVRPEGAFDLLG